MTWYDEIERDPAKWVDGILDHMRGHSYSPFKRIDGGAILTTYHRGDSDEYTWYLAFRDKVRARQDENERRWPTRRARNADESIPVTPSTSSTERAAASGGDANNNRADDQPTQPRE